MEVTTPMLAGITPIIAFSIAKYCMTKLNAKQRKLDPNVEYGTYSGSNVYRVISILFALLVCWIFYLAFFSINFPPPPWAAVVFKIYLVGMVPFTYFIMKDAFKTTYTLSTDGIEKKGIFKIQQVKWADIDEVKISGMGESFDLRRKNKKLMSLFGFFEGMPTIARAIRKNVKTNYAIDASVREILDHTGYGPST